MDPISIALELELATLILAGVGTFATWLHHKHKKHELAQRERHHKERLEAGNTEAPAES